MPKKLTLLLISALLMAGCIGENLDDCVRCRLRFSYTYNDENADRLSAHVQDIHVYVFDQTTRLLVDVIEVGSADIERGWVDIDDLPDGRYTFVAWGGSGEDLSRSFSDSHMYDASAHDHSDSRIGHTTLDEFYMMLDYNNLPVETLGDIAPSREDFDDLFHAVVVDVPVISGRNSEVGFDFVRNTNVLQITVTGLEYLWNYSPTRAPTADQPLHIYAIGKNGRYRADNTIDDDARQVRYEPPCHTLSATSMGVDIKTMRLDIDRHSDDPVLLYVQNAETGDDMIAPLDIIGAIQKTQSTRGEYLYPDQEAIDREYEFPIELSILHDLSVRVTINGWEVVDPDPIFVEP